MSLTRTNSRSPARRRRQVVVITGASGGVGRATAHEFARHGARVALLARGAERLDGARCEVEAAGGEALAIPTDVADAAQVEAAAEQVEQTWGPIDVWVNCAMATVFAPVKQVEADEFKRATEVTYLGTVHGTQAALKRMLPRDRGRIVQVGSALSYRAVPLQAAYCASKFAIRGFTDSLRVELMHDRSNVGLTMVQLSAFNTPQFSWGRTHLSHQPQPMPPIYQPEVAARGIRFAAYANRREVWVGWPAYKAILGNKLAPTLGDRILAKEGYGGQLTGKRVAKDRPDNLYQSPAGDFGTHGHFDDRSRSRSPALWLTMNRNRLLGIAAIALGAATLRRLAV